jgi:rhodanese-related sulfurtransferase
MSYTSHDLLDAARRAIPEVRVEDVATRRTRGDAVLVLDVREKEEVRAGYIEGAITIPRGFVTAQPFASSV